MKQWEPLTSKPARLGIGLMSGTSADGVDAALVRVEGCGTATRVKQLGFAFLPFAPEVRARILQVASGEFGGAAELCRLNFRLGAPLVPYTEYLLYRSETETVALQNIGGIGNITVLPAGCGLEEAYAFDTGPGNMVMDALASRITGGALTYDDGGRLAAAGQVNQELLAWMLQDEYLDRRPPKTTGRERYGAAYVDRLCAEATARGVSLGDTLATATRFTAECIRRAVEDWCPDRPTRLIVGGGGSRNPVLLGHLRQALPGCAVLTNEDLGLNSDSKEAVAFAILANETLFGVCNNAPGATGARHPVVMGKISL